MPSFTTFELVRLLEPGSRNSVWKPSPIKQEKRSSLPEKKIAQAYISLVLYATPKATPIPDSPSSFTPSPYIVNHKRRGPLLLKGSSQPDVLELQSKEEEKEGKAENQGDRPEKVEVGGINGFMENNSTGESSCGELVSIPCEKENGKGVQDTQCGDDGDINDLVEVECSARSPLVDPERHGDFEDFFDPQDSMSITSNSEVEENSGIDRLWKNTKSFREYFDAYEELSSDGALSQFRREDEAELRVIRLNMLMKIEKRTQAEEALAIMPNKWQRIVWQLSLVGFSVPDSLAVSGKKDEEPEVDPAEEVSRQVILARVVAGSVGRGSAKAEVELAMESQIKLKNIEIARLWDKLHYYEAVNHEMSQRNQEAIEKARKHRHRRKRRQSWIWSSIGLAITLGTAALAWSYHSNPRDLCTSTLPSS